MEGEIKPTETSTQPSTTNSTSKTQTTVNPTGSDNISANTNNTINNNGVVKNGNPNSTISEIKTRLIPGIPVPNTLVEGFNNTVNRIPNKTAMKVKRGGKWIGWSWTQYKADVMSVAKSLKSLGTTKNTSTNIIGFNSPEWHISFLGSVFAGGVPTGIYTTSSPSQCEYFANSSEAQVIFVEDEKHLSKYLSIRDQIPNVKAIVVMTPLEDQQSTTTTTTTTTTDANGKEPVKSTSNGHESSSKPNILSKSEYPSGFVYSWEEFLKIGKDIPDSDIDSICKSITSEDILTLIYTSGTTSLPKGCVLTNNNVVWTVYSIAAVVLNDQPHTERFVSYLPLSHIAEQVVTLHAPILFGILVCFADKDALQGTLLATLLEVLPTIFFGVPRVWEKIQLKIQSILSQSNSIKKKLVNWAKVKGIEGGYKSQKGEKKPRGYGLAKKLVFNKITKSLGFQYTRLLASAAAPISKDTLDFFLGLGITITEAYGMSELTGPQTLGYPKYKTGSVGKSLPGSEIKIAEDGEICIKGPNCFSGYWKNDEATKEIIDDEGWVHTGDIGRLDESGYLFITDRKKELIITAGGENIPPSLIEGHLRQIIGLSEAVVIGDRQKYLIALFTVNIQAINTIPYYGHPLPTTIEEASTDKHFNEYLNSNLQEINSKLPNVQTIKKFKVLPVEFSESGNESEITPTKKLKRRVITKKYDSVIREMYGDQYTEGQFNSTIPVPVQTSPSMSSINNHIKSLNSSGVVGTTTSNDKITQEEPVIVNSVTISETASSIPVVKSYNTQEIKDITSTSILPPTSLIVSESKEAESQNNNVDDQVKVIVVEEQPQVDEPITVEPVTVEEQPKVILEETKVEEPIEDVEEPKPIEPVVIVEQVKVEEPKVEESTEPIIIVEQVTVEEPKVEEPIEPVVIVEVKVEEPKVEEPKVEETKIIIEEPVVIVEQVKIEEPKVEEQGKIEHVTVENNEEQPKENNNNQPNGEDHKSSSSLSSSYTSTSDSSHTSDSSDSDSSTYTSSDPSDSDSSYTKSGSSVNTSENESENQ